MKEINVYEGIRKYLPYALFFGANYNVTARRGTAVTTSDLYSSSPKLFFYVKAAETDADNVAKIACTDADALKLSIDTTSPLTITVKLERALTKVSPSIVANGLYYELTARLADGSYMMFDRGKMNILSALNKAS